MIFISDGGNVLASSQRPCASERLQSRDGAWMVEGGGDEPTIEPVKFRRRECQVRVRRSIGLAEELDGDLRPAWQDFKLPKYVIGHVRVSEAWNSGEGKGRQR